MSTPTDAMRSLQGEREAAETRRKAQQRRLLGIVFSFHAVDAALLFCYAGLGVAPASAGWALLLAGVGLLVFGVIASRHALAERWGTIAVVGPMAASSSVLILFLAFWLPQIGVLMLLTLGNVIASSALRLRTSVVFSGTALVTVAAVGILAWHGPRLSLPLDGGLQTLVTCVWVVFILYRGALINLTGVAHRSEINFVNGRLSEALAQIERLATRDELTGLANRRSMKTLLEGAECDPRHGTSSLMLLDIDHFKSVNDRFGHAVGDQVLRLVAQIVHKACRSSDVVARWGGEEFVVLGTNGRDPRSIPEAAERVRKAVSSHDWRSIAPDFRVTISAGITQWLPGEKAELAIARADRLLYRAKGEGRDKVCSDIVGASPAAQHLSETLT